MCMKVWSWYKWSYVWIWWLLYGGIYWLIVVVAFIYSFLLCPVTVTFIDLCMELCMNGGMEVWYMYAHMKVFGAMSGISPIASGYVRIVSKSHPPLVLSLSLSRVLPCDCHWAEVFQALSDTSEQCPPNSLPSNSFPHKFTVSESEKLYDGTMYPFLNWPQINFVFWYPLLVVL